MRLYFALLFLVALMMPVSSLAASVGIGWIPTWDQGLAEARRTHKPILVVSAAPQCHGVSGIW
ncbi:MAG: thioredoxin family protein [Candidatus Obscuribacterales bacterium]|nr:thioredoxin family protein [Candidatus Obscuribacterales bacterium]